MKPIGRVCNKHGFIFGGICEECRDNKINLILKKRGNSITNCHSMVVPICEIAIKSALFRLL